MAKPLCFMVMPYGRRPTTAEAGKGPSEIDFNALWDRAFVPVINQLGYEPVRADQDIGALIITQMLERLYFADLVLADMTIPNGNVHYEIGVRHAAQEKGCVLLAADWSRPLFDLAQMRAIRYPLPEGAVQETTAKAIQDAIAEPISKLAAGASPMYEAIKGYPNEVDPATATTMQGYLRDLAALQGRIRAVRALPPAGRMVEARKVIQDYAPLVIRSSVAIALVRMLREAVSKREDWQVVLDFIARLPEDLAAEAEFREQRAFALSSTGDHLGSIAELQALVALSGPTPERLGLLGGRYKRLLNAAKTEPDRQNFRALAIEAYERGMDLNLNEYYCSSNLPRLYRDRNARGDAERAQRVLNQVILACDSTLARGGSDEWLRPTLLNAAFDAGAADKAEELVDQVDTVGVAAYKLEAILGDLELSARQVSDPDLQRRLVDVARKFRTRMPESVQ